MLYNTARHERYSDTTSTTGLVVEQSRRVVSERQISGLGMVYLNGSGSQIKSLLRRITLIQVIVDSILLKL